MSDAFRFTGLRIFFGSSDLSADLMVLKNGRNHTLGTDDIDSDLFLNEFLTSDEKSKLSSISPSKTFNFKTSSNFFSVGAGVGLDLYIL